MDGSRALARLGLAVGLVAIAQAPAAASAQPPASAARGARLFEAKQCARCHLEGRRGAGPPLAELRRPQGAYELAGRLWNHAPAMFTALAASALEWPRIEPAEMADLMAYLGADPRRDPAPDPLRGHDTLVAKACLKCHAFRGEGARAAPELMERRDRLAPPPVWAATVWRHSPAMAAAAAARGVLYPRFTGDEMAQLVGYLQAGRWAP